MKKIFLFLLLFCFGVPGLMAFEDVETNWYKDAILALKKQGIIQGYDDGSFSPENTISRAEVLKVILSASEAEVVESESQCFSDVSRSSWQSKYVCLGVELGITKGYEDGTFRPGNDVTILEVLAFATRAFELDMSSLGEGDTWYQKYQAYADYNNIIPKHAYSIDTYASRGEAMNIIYRMQQIKLGEYLDYNSSACGVKSTLKSGEYTLEINGNSRSFLLYVPSSANIDSPLGLIVAFHGRTNDNSMVRDYMKLGGGSYGSTKNQQNFIVAYPSGMGAGAYSWAQYENIEFFDALTTYVSENLCIDRDAVFSVGHSLGSYMSNKVSCLRGDVIRAMVGVGSDGYYGTCTAPVTSLILHLPNDHLASYQGGLNAYAYKTEQNLCQPESESMSIGSIGGCETRTSCSLGNSVTFCNSYSTYQNDPHSWPKEGSDDILDFLKNIDTYE